MIRLGKEIAVNDRTCSCAAGRSVIAFTKYLCMRVRSVIAVCKYIYIYTHVCALVLVHVYVYVYVYIYTGVSMHVCRWSLIAILMYDFM